MRPLRALVIALILLVAGAGAPGLSSAASPPAASARGLDVLVAGPRAAAPGATIALALQVVGYRSVRAAAPIEGATIEVAWDPAQGGPVGPPVRVETGAGGQGTATVVMPREQLTARLLVTARHGGRSRTRVLEITSMDALEVDVIVPDPQVVPGSRVGAWVRVRDRVEGRRLAGVPVVARVLDGGVTRDEARASTDATGSALVFLRVPRLPDGAAVNWSLQATVGGAARRSVELAPREEVPAQPRLDLAWDAATVAPGATAAATLRLRDASGDPVAGAAIEWTITPLRRDDQTLDDWDAVRTGVTDADGRLRVTWATPSVVGADGLGARLAARASIADRQIERDATLQVRTRHGASLEAIPEGGALVPGIAQRLFLRARGDDGAPIEGDSRVTGDGLDAAVHLDRHGEAEITWTPPIDVGSRRDIGRCARGVAATIALEEGSGQLARSGGRALACVTVDRDREALLVVEPAIARAGERVRVKIVPRRAGAAARPAAIVLAPHDDDRGVARATWIADGEVGADIEVPAGPAGAWAIAAHVPRDGAPALEAAASVLVAPRLLPRLTARVAGGRITAGGEVEIEARLSDEAGRPVDGLVAALVHDAFGGGGSAELERLDVRAALCEAAFVPRERCEGAWSGEPHAAALVRAGLAPQRRELARAGLILDPGRTAGAELDEAFAATLRSLEGAVFEATSSPDRLIDARRDGPAGRTFNPELFRLVTEALGTPPTTPGGEPIELADLVAVDPQVRFDVVARRVTRLKVFRVLEHVRAHRHENDLDLDEPALADPTALLARLTARGDLAPSALLDPWGGTLAFRRARRPGIGPILGALPGWELASPGPDGRPGTADDVADPFERIVTSGSPYARALDEDAVVLARGDLRIGDETVRAWSELLERSTGTALAGHGFGSGSGRLGGAHRTRAPSVRMGATMVNRRAREPAWELPTRTRGGVARLRLPLGTLDTTYRVVLVGLADGGEPAVATVDVPVTTPIAARVEAGERWLEGDRLEVPIRLRNRTASPAQLTLEVTARGAARRVAGEPARSAIVVPPRGTAVAHATLHAASAGEAVVDVVVRDGSGREVDATRATIPVEHAGRRVTLSRARWVEGAVEVPAIVPGAGERALGAPRLVVEAGVEDALAAALRAVDPDGLATSDALADAAEIATRVRLHAVARGDDALARSAASLAERAGGRLGAASLDGRSAVARRARLFLPTAGDDRDAAPCEDDAPPRARGERRDASAEWRELIALLEAEPPPREGATSACWESIASDAKQAATGRRDVVATARLLLAFAERPHRREDAIDLARRLARDVTLAPSGRVALPAPHTARREARALVLAALLRASTAGIALAASREALLGWLVVQRDGTGGFGSPLATRAAVTALVAASGPPAAAHRAVAVTLLDDEGEPVGTARQVELTAAVHRAVAPLDPRAATVRVASTGGVLVRVEREVLRPSSATADVLASPLRLDVTWPARPRAGGGGVLRIAVRSLRPGEARASVRVPLPAGVSLGSATEGVRAVPGALLVDVVALDDDAPVPVTIPVRFAIAGDLAVPEASARLSEEASSPAYAPPRRLVVRR